MTRFVYHKDNGDISDRDVVPIGFIFDDRNKVLCIDMEGVESEDRKKLDHIRRDYLNSIYEEGFKIKTFFLDGITDVKP